MEAPLEVPEGRRSIRPPHFAIYYLEEEDPKPQIPATILLSLN
jgi:hypothetical protein